MTNIPMMEVPVPSLEDTTLDAFMPAGSSAEALLQERQTLIANQENMDLRIAEIDIVIGTAQDLAGVKNVLWEGHCPKKDCNGKHLVMRREASKGRETLDRVRLLEAGVSPLQLAAGTKVGKPGKSGVTVRHASDKKGEAANFPGDVSPFTL